jgi:hypothetical protein
MIRNSNGEVIACLHGVQAAIDIVINYLELETNALMVKQALLSNAFENSDGGGPVTELKAILQLNFEIVLILPLFLNIYHL